MNFLVVDDNRSLCRNLCLFLRGKGHTASSLSDPKAVKRWLTSNTCHCVVLDYGMPGMDGVDLLMILRPEFPDLPIVMYSGVGYDEDIMAACRKAGCDAYISKGLGYNELYNAMMRVIERRQTESA
jgi:DNA-binding response OmpR family regulator